MGLREALIEAPTAAGGWDRGAARLAKTGTGRGHRRMEGLLVGVGPGQGVGDGWALEADELAGEGGGPLGARPRPLAVVAMEALRNAEFDRGAVIGVGRRNVPTALAGWKGAAR